MAQLTPMTTLSSATIVYPSGNVNLTFDLCLQDTLGNKYGQITYNAALQAGADPKAVISSINAAISQIGLAPVPALGYAPVSDADAATIQGLATQVAPAAIAVAQVAQVNAEPPTSGAT